MQIIHIDEGIFIAVLVENYITQEKILNFIQLNIVS